MYIKSHQISSRGQDDGCFLMLVAVGRPTNGPFKMSNWDLSVSERFGSNNASESLGLDWAIPMPKYALF